MHEQLQEDSNEFVNQQLLAFFALWADAEDVDTYIAHVLAGEYDDGTVLMDA
jgi:hypothetical protein